MRGDILFYKSSGDLFDRLVAWRTGGPYVHVEVEVEDGVAVGALNTGVSKHPVVPTDVRYPTAQRAPSRLVTQAIGAVVACVTDEYAWEDIADAALPRGWPVLFHGAKEYDCSHLVAVYMVDCGLGRLLGNLRTTPQSVSPNDIARACSILP